MSNTVISFPIPPYQNVPIQSQFYQPSQFVITAISLGPTTTITTAIDNNYVIGQLCRLTIPSKYGSRALNEQQAYVISLPASDQVVLDLNSTGSDPFIPSPTFLPFESQTPPQIMAIGDINTGVVNGNGRSPVGTFIPGSFINISPI